MVTDAEVVDDPGAVVVGKELVVASVGVGPDVVVASSVEQATTAGPRIAIASTPLPSSAMNALRSIRSISSAAILGCYATSWSS